MHPSPFDHAAAQGHIPPGLQDRFGAWFRQMPGLKPLLAALIARVGALNINWEALAGVIADAIAAGGGPFQVLIAILANLGGVLNQPQEHALPAAAALVAYHGVLSPPGANSA